MLTKLFRPVALTVASLLSLSAIAEEPAPTVAKTTPVPDAILTDYARRLQAEMQQLAAQYQADSANLQAIQAAIQASTPPSPNADADPPKHKK